MFRVASRNYDTNVAAAQTVRDIATSKHAKPGQIALAWLLHKGLSVVPRGSNSRRRRTCFEAGGLGQGGVGHGAGLAESRNAA